MSFNLCNASEDVDAELAQLVRTLHETQERMAELTGGRLGTVMHPSGVSHLTEPAKQRWRGKEAEQQREAPPRSAILNALPANIALLDANGVIVAVNESWHRFAAAN